MKMKNIVLFSVLSTSALLAQSGEALFGKYCASCHTTVIGVNESGGELTNVYEAPYAGDVIRFLLKITLMNRIRENLFMGRKPSKTLVLCHL
ncbi:MAG: hypothetical protein B6D54_05010 [Epsilonproteobacteria bacterium 4484_65]|nr:MAG: hypothetical protein B6D54_05010 [Epsilonproteobacteria bacterium 4484_65]